MELVFLLVLVVLMAGALASGYPVAFALPGAAKLVADTPFDLPRGLNKQWTDGGLLYSPPFR